MLPYPPRVNGQKFGYHCIKAVQTAEGAWYCQVSQIIKITEQSKSRKMEDYIRQIRIV